MLNLPLPNEDGRASEEKGALARDTDFQILRPIASASATASRPTAAAAARNGIVREEKTMQLGSFFLHSDEQMLLSQGI